jgi:hypothetical protein
MFHLPIPIEGKSGKPINVIKRQSQEYDYNILQYKWETNEKNSEYMCESGECHEPYTILTNSQQTKVFAFMPPRQTIDYHSFRKDYADSEINQDATEIEVREAIEGTMITFFWNDEIEKWDICTRNGVGCNYAFNRPTFSTDALPKTFREMVLDALRIRSSSNINDLSDATMLNYLSKTFCYVCVLQHPENHIVYSHSHLDTCLKLIAIYETGAMPPLVPNDSNEHYLDSVREVSSPQRLQEYLSNPFDEFDEQIWNSGFNVFGQYPVTIEFLQSTSELITFKQDLFDQYRNVRENIIIHSKDIDEHSHSIYYPPAWHLTNIRTGQRCEIPNPFYEKAKSLRDMQPNLRYLYLTQRKNKTVEYYLKAFPRYTEEFLKLGMEYEYFIIEVRNAYVQFYILKQRDSNERIPKQYFVHAARIHHNIYLKVEDPSKRKTVNKQTVIEYFDQFTPSKMFYFITNKEEEPQNQLNAA